jgi:hypothetical protein
VAVKRRPPDLKRPPPERIAELRKALAAGRVKLPELGGDLLREFTMSGFAAQEPPRDDFSGWARRSDGQSLADFSRSVGADRRETATQAGERELRGRVQYERVKNARVDSWSFSTDYYPVTRPPWHDPWCTVCRKFIPNVTILAEPQANGDKVFSLRCHGDVQRVRLSPAECERRLGYGKAFSNSGANQW